MSNYQGNAPCFRTRWGAGRRTGSWSDFPVHKSVWWQPYWEILHQDLPRQGLPHRSEEQSGKRIIDEGVQEILKKYNTKDYLPLVSSPNGNCFYNSASISICGTEDLATELRARCYIDLALNKKEIKSKYPQIVAFCGDFREITDTIATDQSWSSAFFFGFSLCN